MFSEHSPHEADELIQMIKQLSSRLAREVAIQRALLQAKHHDYEVTTRDISVNQVVKELMDTIKSGTIFYLELPLAMNDV